MRFGSRWACAIAVAIVIAVLMGGTAGLAASSPPTLVPVALPRDHAAHPGFQVEWWYTAGTVAADRGDDYFWFATVWASMGALVARVNVVDLQSDRVVLSQEYTTFAALAAHQTEIDVGRFGLGWRAAGALGQWSVDAAVGARGLLRLDLTPVQPYVLNGSNGIVSQGSGALSAYYSDPRLAAQGTLEINGRSTRVSGQGWFDHQWGNFASNASSTHWNWFACQFANRSDLMLYQFITPAGQPTGIQSASFVSPAGTVAHPQQFTVTPLAPMIRPAGARGTYPLAWHLVVPSAHVDVTLEARARNQFIANQLIPGFWEGAAAITSGAPGSCIVESTREPL
jgi:predicted secreted hydrolase